MAVSVEGAVDWWMRHADNLSRWRAQALLGEEGCLRLPGLLLFLYTFVRAWFLNGACLPG